MRIAIAGGLGFIGSAIAGKAIQRGFHVTILTRRAIMSEQPLHPRLKILTCTIPSHLNEWKSDLEESEALIAAIGSGAPSKACYEPHEEIAKNLIPLTSLIQECLMHKPNKLVLISSAGTVYGETLKEPAHEKCALNPVGLYGATKASQEIYTLAICARANLRLVIARLSNPYGPWQLPGGGQGLIANAINTIEEGKCFQIWGTGQETRDYIYIDDAADALLRLSTSTHKGVFNVASESTFSTTQIIKIIEDVSGKTIARSQRDPEFPLPAHIAIGNTKLRQELGWIPRVTIWDGIDKAITWYRHIYKEIDHSPPDLTMERIKHLTFNFYQ